MGHSYVIWWLVGCADLGYDGGNPSCVKKYLCDCVVKKNILHFVDLLHFYNSVGFFLMTRVHEIQSDWMITTYFA